MGASPSVKINKPGLRRTEPVRQKLAMHGPQDSSWHQGSELSGSTTIPDWPLSILRADQPCPLHSRTVRVEGSAQRVPWNQPAFPVTVMRIYLCRYSRHEGIAMRARLRTLCSVTFFGRSMRPLYLAALFGHYPVTLHCIYEQSGMFVLQIARPICYMTSFFLSSGWGPKILIKRCRES